MLFILGWSSIWSKEPPVMTIREELKTKAAREEWEKIVTQGWRRTQEDKSRGLT